MKVVIFILLMLPMFAFAQDTDAYYQKMMSEKEKQDGKVIFPIDSITKEVKYSKIIKVDSISADQLYSRAKLFVASNFRNPKTVTALNDDVAKTILIKPAISNHVKDFMINDDWGYTSYQLFIECKDGRYRYSVTGVQHNGQDGTRMVSGGRIDSEKGNGFTKKTWQQVQLQADNGIKYALSLLEKAMLKPLSDF